MPLREDPTPAPSAPELELLERIAVGELPLAAAPAAFLRRPALASARRLLLDALRGLRRPPGDPLPWAAVWYGLDEPEYCVRRDVVRAARFVARLRAAPAARRAGLMRRARREARNPALPDALIAEARRVVGADPAEALTWLDFAQEVVGRLAVTGFPERLLTPAALRIEAHRANALRAAGELPEAARRYQELARDPRRHELPRPADQAELLSLEASLRIDLRQFEAAEKLLDRAERLYRVVGETVGAARALLKRGSAGFYACEPKRAVELFDKALELVEPAAEPVLFFMINDNLADALVDLGRPAEARSTLAVHPELFGRVEDLTVRLRRRWIQARIARAEERFEEAARLFAEVRNGWLSHQRPYEAALATLDTAELHFARGNWRDVKRQAALLAPIFAARGVHREACAALTLFQQAAKAETLTADLLASLRRYLLLARNDPTFRFDPAAA